MEITFSKDDVNGYTQFHEVIDYQCPWILSPLCSSIAI